ncbi:MAG: hypothetical protein A3G34_01915 [Candidatus Lindowbacteria bacterium RIFCSPLOWO2_12_FULL_62_27]|nr:MAG: hypothetical protein A3I06_11435 [Candidatus Lindowbacteria bacterium RIFCSPLOWO2_02_FULL_62_12]OGH59065.1 MAG: hypothetical protein A3G34_01915 [Candidatus Lindowbacteria bacterium RIFCSPLOWO2_12_FULL_62_27]
MAEFCLACYLSQIKPEDVDTAAVALSEGEELCEGCGEFKQIVETVAEPVPRRRTFREIFLRWRI